jgi:hypothetical protein
MSSIKRLVPLNALQLSSNPTNGKIGDLYFNTVEQKLKVFNGTSWVLVSDSSVDQELISDVAASLLNHEDHNGISATFDDLANKVTLSIDQVPASGYTSTVKHEVRAAANLTKGQAVYVTGSNGTNMLVNAASNSAESTSSKTFGLLAQDLSTNNLGFVVTEGILSGLNTSSAQQGDPVWLGTNGSLIYGLTNKPHAPAHLVFIGIVTRVNSNNGEIFVKIQNGFELDELHDVLISSPQNKQLLSYDSSTGLWKNVDLDSIRPLQTLNIQQVDGNGNIVENYGSISAVQFDEDSGFDVTNPSPGIAKIAMNSTFKYWEVDGVPGLTAEGLDTVNFVSGTGIDIVASSLLGEKSIKIDVDTTQIATVSSVTNTLSSANTYTDNKIAQIPDPTIAQISATPPSSPTTGDLWLESDTGLMFAYDGSYWVDTSSSSSSGGGASSLSDLTDIDMSNIQDGEVLVYDQLSLKWVNSNTIATKSYADSSVSTHSSDSTNVHGIADTALLATKSYADNAAAVAAAAIIDSAPSTLNTLNELAAAINDDASYAANITNALGNKASLSGIETLTNKTLYNPIISAVATENVAETKEVWLAATENRILLYPLFEDIYKIYLDDISTLVPNDKYEMPVTLQNKTATIIEPSGLESYTFNATDFNIDYQGSNVVLEINQKTSESQVALASWSQSSINSTIKIRFLTGDTANQDIIYTIPSSELIQRKKEVIQSVSSNITAQSGHRYFVDTSASRTLTLPSSPELGDEIQIFDSSGTASTYNITVSRNGNKVNGGTGNLIIDMNGAWITLVYTGSTYGWKVA